MKRATWSIIYRAGERVYLHNGEEVSEAQYKAANPPKAGEIAAGGMNVLFVRPPDSGWEYENGGRGRYIGQLGKPNDPNCYHRSVDSAKEEARRRGWQHIENA